MEAMLGKGKEKVNMEEIYEDRCFECKAGGSLFVCKFENCLKAYHAGCVEKYKSFSESGGGFACKWHACFICHDWSKYQCYCCPKALCERCIGYAEFAKLGGTKGFCINCLKALLLGEKKNEADSEGDKVDLRDINTKEGLFFEYWLMIKGKENLSLKHLSFAYNLLKSGETHTSLSNPSGLDKLGNESLLPTFREEDIGSKDQKALKKTQVKSTKKEYIGWGSKPLIDFLVSIGKDISKEISQLDVASIINRYINENSLFNAEKKRKILCDERLNALFGKKSFTRNSIYNLLELHYRENAEFHEQDRQSYNSEEDNENDSKLPASKKQKKTNKCKKTEKEVVIEVPRSCFASIVVDNIKLVYLNRSIVMELLEEPEGFESMVIGSIVKVKSDPYDSMQKNHYQLVQVTGVKNISPGGKKEDILLQVTNRFDGFTVNMLSDGNFSEEECEDLSKRVKSGQLRKLTIVEIEEKAKSLHLIITKHWIVRELAMLQRRIDHENEKGRRAEFFKLMEKREQLETDAEQKRLLKEVPKVFAEVLEIELANQELKQGDETPLKLILTAELEAHGNQWGGDISSSGYKADTEDNLSGNTESISANFGKKTTKGDEAPRSIQDSNKEESHCKDQLGANQKSEPRQCRSQMQSQSHDVEQKLAKTEQASPIDLSNDDENGDSSIISLQKKKSGFANMALFGTKRKEYGRFSLWFLERWGFGFAIPIKSAVDSFTGESKTKAWSEREVIFGYCHKFIFDVLYEFFTDLFGKYFSIFLVKNYRRKTYRCS